MDGKADMESCHVLSTRDCRLSARIANLVLIRRAYAAPAADWRMRRFGYGWRDPHRWRASRRVTFSFYKSRIRMQQGNK